MGKHDKKKKRSALCGPLSIALHVKQYAISRIGQQRKSNGEGLAIQLVNKAATFENTHIPHLVFKRGTKRYQRYQRDNQTR